MKTNKEITWEASRFNAQTLVEDGSLVLYNSYTGAIASFPPTEADVIRQWLKKPVPQQQNLSIHQELFTHMIRQGFWFPIMWMRNGGLSFCTSPCTVLI
ncbi:hypothetical protein [Paenibacillus larvae]|uniref:hypothetical protein n=1 Tax=Paenibacillus larvae TaxID=1464 RepID=UPI00288F1C29|nr:hypothetical protein [Paenibacillus larvae]MDT2192369.1 hypothetical protein [Paenibacillus larvae]MDT2239668.1 hypothetical protein [Paenibacillus larvae]MDT2246313.1 hypothetical protein [Paenibacillus larvae]MDT2259318.1 hypothetical protein [Paenibacillus larvae]MDT2274826.1 hypothetical protein [Paenibacillus larvae]